MDDQSLYLVFPENATSEVLLQMLRKHGTSPHVLTYIEMNKEDVVHEFYNNLAALPRRLPHDNRRGRTLAKVHEKERMNAKTLENKLLKNASWKAPSRVVKQNSKYSSANNSTSATPELDRLEARSKTAKRSLATEDGTKSAVLFKKQSLSRNAATTTSEGTVEALQMNAVSFTSTPSQTTSSTHVKTPSPQNKKKGKVKLKRSAFLSSSSETCKISKIT